MLSKKQLIDASNCNDLRVTETCDCCSMKRHKDCVVSTAKTALKLMKENKRLEKELQKSQERYSELDRYVKQKYKDY